MDGVSQIVVAGTAAYLEPEGLPDLGEIRERQPRLRSTADDVVGKVVLLGLTDRAVSVVVQDDHLDRKSISGDRLELLQVQHHATVTGQADDPLARGIV